MPVKKGTTTNESEVGFTDFERDAMKKRALELKAAHSGKVDGETAVQNALAAMEKPSRDMGERLHALITEAAPMLSPKTWYGMPAYANAEGKVICFFRPAEKFKERYMTFGFNDLAKLDEGVMWPVAYAVKKLTSSEEKKIVELVKKAVS